MSEVRRTGNYEQWVSFFLEAVANASSDALNAIKHLAKLHDKNVTKLPKSNRKQDNLRIVFNYLEQHPIIDIKKTAETLSLSYNTVSTAIKKLIDLGIVKETTNAARNRVFVYEEYLEILKEGTE